MKKFATLMAVAVTLAVPAQAGPFCRPVAEIICELLPIPL